MIYPVILSGGSGTRLWPLSRKSYPKQFSPLIGHDTLFQRSAERLSNGAAAGLDFAAPLVITNSDFRFIAAEQLAGIGIDPGTILLEPEGRNTAPAVLAAALHVAETDPDGVVLVAPSDHIVEDIEAFHRAVAQGLTAVEAGQLVTFGITPTHPETAYGYLELADQPDGSGQPVALSRFVEKPDEARAAEMLAAGSFMWNAGIFLFRARDMIAAFETHAPGLVAPVRAALREARPDLGFLRLAPGPWARAEEISMDYAVMEKAETSRLCPSMAAGPILVAGMRSGTKWCRTRRAWRPRAMPPRSNVRTACSGLKAMVRSWSGSGLKISLPLPWATRCWWPI